MLHGWIPSGQATYTKDRGLTEGLSMRESFSVEIVFKLLPDGREAAHCVQRPVGSQCPWSTSRVGVMRGEAGVVGKG